MTRCYWMYMVLWPSSWHHAHPCHTIIHIQSYTYKRTHTIIQWCCTRVCDAFPWEVVYETFLWKAVLIPGLCACIGAVQRIDCRIPGLCAFHPCRLPEWWLDPLVLATATHAVPDRESGFAFFYHFTASCHLCCRVSLNSKPTPSWQFDISSGFAVVVLL